MDKSPKAQATKIKLENRIISNPKVNKKQRKKIETSDRMREKYLLTIYLLEDDIQNKVATQKSQWITMKVFHPIKKLAKHSKFYH